MTWIELRQQFQIRLQKEYDPGEAQSLTRIVFEDQFDWLHLDLRHPVSEQDLATAERLLQGLLAHHPVQYLTGIAYFYGLKLSLDTSVLIPRPETEELVEWILEDHPPVLSNSLKILDIGTGSGCIPLAIKKHRPEWEVLGIDVSPEALAVARKNAGNTDLEVRFLEADILQPAAWADLPVFDLVISNPPYIPRSEQDRMDRSVLEYEPHLALFVADEDPLIFYRQILHFSKNHLAPKGTLYFECNEFNSRAVQQLALDRGFKAATLRQDLYGKDRMLRVKAG